MRGKEGDNQKKRRLKYEKDELINKISGDFNFIKSHLFRVESL